MVITVDAKQRAILSAHRLLGADGKPNSASVRAFCSEPSPDVFSVIAQSLSAGGSFGKTANPASLDIALNLAYSSAENGSTIPRTQTINMLRELMFRTCERYLSGGYDETELSLQAIRDQRLMVSILAIEQLTGAITPKPVVLGAAGSAAAGITGDALVRLDDARKARDKANSAHESAVADYEQVNGDTKVCDAIKDKPETGLSDEQKAKVKPCADAGDAVTAALAERTAKTAAYQELSSLARSGGVSVSTTLESSAEGGLDRVSPQAVADVSLAVREIVGHNFNDDTEGKMFCMRILRSFVSNQGGDRAAVTIRPEQLDKLKDTCVSFLESDVRLNTEERNEKLRKLGVEMPSSFIRMKDATKTNFTRFWTSSRQVAFSDPVARRKFVDWLKSRLPRSGQAKADCFANATTDFLIADCFDELTPRQQEEAIAR